MVRPSQMIVPSTALLAALIGCGPEDSTDVDQDSVETAVDTDRDTSDVIHTADETGGETDTGLPDPIDTGLPGTSSLAVGELVVTEIMVNPTDCTDPRGEYVEFVYQGTRSVDLGGLVLTNPVGTGVALAGPFQVNPGQRFVLFAEPRNSSPCYNFGTKAAGYDPLLVFPNQGDILIVQDEAGRELDRVDYASFGPVPEGASWELHVAPDPGANDDPANWCVAQDLISGSSADRGTPGLDNTCTPTSDTDSGGPTFDRLLLTEIVDFDVPSTLRYVEVWNPGAAPVDLGDWELAVYEDGSSIPVRSSFPAGASVPAGGCYIVGPDNGTLPADFQAAFGVSAGAFLNAVRGDGNDAYALLQNGVRVDTYGQIGTDGSGTFWDYRHQVAWRDPSVQTPRATMLPSEWSVGPLARRNPCARGPAEVDTDTDAFESDSFIEFETGIREDTYDTDIIDTSVVPIDVTDLQPGDLVITEIMAAPTHCSGSNGEYIEFYVDPRVGAPVDLDGLQIQNASGLSVGYSGSYLATPGQFVTAWFRPTSQAQCYGWEPGAGLDYNVLTLNDGGDLVRLKYESVTFDEVDFRSGFSVTPGVSLQLDNRRYDASLNNQAANWCGARTSIVVGAFPIGDRGTPFFDNGPCIGLGDVGDTDVPVLTPQDLLRGDLVITEVMGSTAGTCSNDNGQYVEVINNTPARVRLNGLRLVVGSANDILTTAVELQPQEIAILARTPQSVGCFNFGGIQTVNYANALAIPSGGSRIALESGATTIDEVNFSLFSPPFVEGAAWTLDEDKVDATLNNVQGSWCAGGDPIGAGNSGLPGSLRSCNP